MEILIFFINEERWLFRTNARFYGSVTDGPTTAPEGRYAREMPPGIT